MTDQSANRRRAAEAIARARASRRPEPVDPLAGVAINPFTGRAFLEPASSPRAPLTPYPQEQMNADWSAAWDRTHPGPPPVPVRFDPFTGLDLPNVQTGPANAVAAVTGPQRPYSPWTDPEILDAPLQEGLTQSLRRRIDDIQTNARLDAGLRDRQREDYYDALSASNPVQGAIERLSAPFVDLATNPTQRQRLGEQVGGAYQYLRDRAPGQLVHLSEDAVNSLPGLAQRAPAAAQRAASSAGAVLADLPNWPAEAEAWKNRNAHGIAEGAGGLLRSFASGPWEDERQSRMDLDAALQAQRDIGNLFPGEHVASSGDPARAADAANIDALFAGLNLSGGVNDIAQAGKGGAALYANEARGEDGSSVDGNDWLAPVLLGLGAGGAAYGARQFLRRAPEAVGEAGAPFGQFGWRYANRATPTETLRSVSPDDLNQAFRDYSRSVSPERAASDAGGFDEWLRARRFDRPNLLAQQRYLDEAPGGLSMDDVLQAGEQGSPEAFNTSLGPYRVNGPWENTPVLSRPASNIPAADPLENVSLFPAPRQADAARSNIPMEGERGEGIGAARRSIVLPGFAGKQAEIVVNPSRADLDALAARSNSVGYGVSAEGPVIFDGSTVTHDMLERGGVNWIGRTGRIDGGANLEDAARRMHLPNAEAGYHNVSDVGAQAESKAGTEAAPSLQIPDNPNEWRTLVGQHPWINSPSRAQLVIMMNARRPDGAFRFSTDEIANVTRFENPSAAAAHARDAGVPIEVRPKGPQGGTRVPGGDKLNAIITALERAAANGEVLSMRQLSERIGAPAGSIKVMLSNLRTGNFRGNPPQALLDRFHALDARLRELRGKGDSNAGALLAALGLGAGATALGSSDDAEASAANIPVPADMPTEFRTTRANPDAQIYHDPHNPLPAWMAGIALAGLTRGGIARFAPRASALTRDLATIGTGAVTGGLVDEATGGDFRVGATGGLFGSLPVAAGARALETGNFPHLSSPEYPRARDFSPHVVIEPDPARVAFGREVQDMIRRGERELPSEQLAAMRRALPAPNVDNDPLAGIDLQRPATGSGGAAPADPLAGLDAFDRTRSYRVNADDIAANPDGRGHLIFSRAKGTARAADELAAVADQYGVEIARGRRGGVNGKQTAINLARAAASNPDLMEVLRRRGLLAALISAGAIAASDTDTQQNLQGQ